MANPVVDPHRLRFLAGVARHGTVTAAAEAAGYTTSALSQALSSLQGDLGVTLLERRGRRVVLTRAGQALVDSSEGVFAALEEAQNSVARAVGEVAGTVRIGCWASVFITLVPPAVQTLESQFEGLELEVSEIPHGLRDRLRSGDIDVAIHPEYTLTPFEDEDDDLIRFPVLVEPIFLVAADADADRPFADLVRGDWAFGEAGECRRVSLEVARRLGVQPRARFHSDSHGVLIPLAQMGASVSILPATNLIPRPDGLHLILLAGVERRVDVWVRRSWRGLPVVEAIVEALRQEGRRVRAEFEDLADRRETVDRK